MSLCLCRYDCLSVCVYDSYIMSMPISLSRLCVSVYVPLCLSVSLFVRVSVCLSVFVGLSLVLFVCLCPSLYVSVSVYLPHAFLFSRLSSVFCHLSSLFPLLSSPFSFSFIKSKIFQWFMHVKYRWGCILTHFHCPPARGNNTMDHILEEKNVHIILFDG